MAFEKKSFEKIFNNKFKDFDMFKTNPNSQMFTACFNTIILITERIFRENRVDENPEIKNKIASVFDIVINCPKFNNDDIAKVIGFTLLGNNIRDKVENLLSNPLQQMVPLITSLITNPHMWTVGYILFAMGAQQVNVSKLTISQLVTNVHNIYDKTNTEIVTSAEDLLSDVIMVMEAEKITPFVSLTNFNMLLACIDVANDMKNATETRTQPIITNTDTSFDTVHELSQLAQKLTDKKACSDSVRIFVNMYIMYLRSLIPKLSGIGVKYKSIYATTFAKTCKEKFKINVNVDDSGKLDFAYKCLIVIIKEDKLTNKTIAEIFNENMDIDAQQTVYLLGERLTRFDVNAGVKKLETTGPAMNYVKYDFIKEILKMSRTSVTKHRRVPGGGNDNMTLIYSAAFLSFATVAMSFIPRSS